MTSGVRARRAGVALVLLFGTTCTLAQEATDRFAGAAAAYLVRADARTLYAAAADVPLPPASLTKMMTALVIDETTQRDAIVMVSARAAGASGARIGLRAGMRMRVADLQAAMLMRSANDACHALADHVPGGEAGLVALMNVKAKALKLPSTHFTNPCGFDGPRHRSSAVDLARIADALLERPMLASLVAASRRRITSIEGRVFEIANTNALIDRVDGARGIKTGFTNRAGHCLVGLVEREGVRVLVVLLNARDRWWDAVAMIDAAFEASSRPR